MNRLDLSLDEYNVTKKPIDSIDNVSCSASLSSSSSTSRLESKLKEIVHPVDIPTRFSNLDVTIQKQVHLDDRHELGRNYVVKVQDVISGNFSGSGRPKRSIHPGNRRLLVVIEMFRIKYKKSANRSAKSNIIRHVVDVIRECGGHFVKRDASSGMWYDIGNNNARYKVRMLFRQARLNMSKTSSPLDDLLKMDDRKISSSLIQDSSQHDIEDDNDHWCYDEESTSTHSDHKPYEWEYHNSSQIQVDHDWMPISNDYRHDYVRNISIREEHQLQRIESQVSEIRILQNQVAMEQALLRQMPSPCVTNFSGNHGIQDETKTRWSDEDLSSIDPIDIYDSSSMLFDDEIAPEDFMDVFNTSPNA